MKGGEKIPKKSKIFKDPIHGYIEIFPFELKIINLKIFQRLRYIKQTPSVSYVFHSANHTRFEHSLGCLHIAEMYARNLHIKDPEKELLRLCALLHDIGHCIFSHQYDVTVYKEIYPREKHGHDEHRKKIIREYIPEVLVKSYYEDELKISIRNSGLSNYLKSELKESTQSIMNDVSDILKSKGTWKYNIIHGPFGCDRLDFIKRDSYFSGTEHYGGFPLDRFILFSSLEEDGNGNKILCYSSKILDDIIVFLINRFHMFKNVYFHKTCRALDLMFQQLLEYSKEPLNLVERTKNIEAFENLNELNFFSEISYYYQKNFDELKEKFSKEKILDFLSGKIEIEEFSTQEDIMNELETLKKIFKAYKLVKRILSRDLYKTILDKAVMYPHDLIRTCPPEKYVKNVAEDKKKEIETKYLSKERKKCPALFIDMPYELTMNPIKELPGSHIDIYLEDEKKVKKYNELKREKNFETWSIESFNIYRIYTTSNTNRIKLIPIIDEIKKSGNKEADVDTQI